MTGTSLRTSKVISAAFSVATILVVLSLLELVQALSPMRPHDLIWRASAIGLVSRVLAVPFVALFVAYAAASFSENPRSLKILSAITGTCCVLLAVGLILFLFDGAQLRSQLTAQARSTYDRGMVLAMIKLVIGAVSLGIFAVVQWRTSKIGGALAATASHSRVAPPVLRASRTSMQVATDATTKAVETDAVESPAPVVEPTA